MLLEALVGLLIFTIGVLGLLGLQASMVQAQASANYRAEAAQLATDLTARMWVDVNRVAEYTDPASCKANALCNEWLTRVAARLPGNLPPVIARDDNDRITIAISWVTSGDGGDPHTFNTTTSVTPQPPKTP